MWKPQNSEMIVVREVTSNDADRVSEICSLANRALRRIYRPKRSALAGKARRDPELRRLVALMDDEVVGTVQYLVAEGRLHLIGLAVHPDYQQRGIARQLVESLSNRVRQLKLRRLSLYTIRETGNVLIFERLCFRVVVEKPDELSESDGYGQLTEVYMERVIP